MHFLYKATKVILLVVGLYGLLNFSRYLGGAMPATNSHEPLSYALLFIAGTLTGVHCAGMCGSLVLSYTVRVAHQSGTKYLTHLYYGAGKTLSYTLMGAVFGLLGSIVTFTPFMRGFAGFAAGIFLLLFGLSSLRMLPVKRDLQFKMPPTFMRYLGGLLRQCSSPFAIGLLNGLMIICGPLQAMYIMAAGTGSPLEGAKILFFFGLGTLPLMMGFGFLASALSAQFAPKLVRASGVIVVALGIVMAQRGYLMLTTGEDVHAAMGHTLGAKSNQTMVHTRIDQSGSIPVIPQIELGKDVEWMVMGDALAQCGGGIAFQEEPWRFVLPSEGGSFALKPTQIGTLHWRCESGSIQGAFEVVPAKPTFRMPMADQLLHLIEKSSDALEALRHQLHP
jgi:sulfite exporter TauE/SafE